ncbi:unnamed protein product (macronuclear) [Paramecium tetraurelia]|uniref:Protein kinase domain-containing protein n=1 Tax=Paramecium tetraurelia TaxID=5888 RepID=A0CEX5_PARTE|nr:uncharacterized protein GSPATT00037781001 [Paramecium tetraurelia]CAK69342.1 unnamed protein product [Paramecium tetraurelia]|eukprot:XP_001436739.1 hypothetical protein (macronuclear) [Paramecium tetraurelia strain d4-2]
MQNINYKESKFQFECFRKHLLKDAKYYGYLLPNQLILTTAKQSQTPKYNLPLLLNTLIHFVTKQPSNEIEQFGFLYKEHFKYFYANPNIILQLKELLACKVMFKEISEFYQPISMLGRGGSSKVYQVMKKGSKDQYASKCVDKRYLIEDGGFNGLFNEIQLMQKMNHPKIIHLEELYEGENTFYLILEYLQGQSLHESFNKRQVLFEQEQIQTIMFQLLTAVQYMHSLGIMHRDLKPENIMFKSQNAYDELKIVDFGLATSTQAETYPFPKCGTPGYVAPEIANLKDLNYKYDLICDMFSIGCIFYKLLTGKELFPGTDYQEILKLNKKCSINYELLTLYRAPKEAIELIAQLLTINPKERISAQAALQHNYFQLKFQTKRGKFQQNNNKYTPVFQTQNFNPKDNIQKQNFHIEDDVVEDENAHSVKVPVMQKMKTFDQFVCKIKPQVTPTLARRNFKKFQTSDFNSALSPNSPNPLQMENKPSLIINSSNQDLVNEIHTKNEHQINQMGQIDEEQEEQFQQNI